jgi:hypothetical protein
VETYPFKNLPLGGGKAKGSASLTGKMQQDASGFPSAWFSILSLHITLIIGKNVKVTKISFIFHSCCHSTSTLVLEPKKICNFLHQYSSYDRFVCYRYFVLMTLLIIVWSW